MTKRSLIVTVVPMFLLASCAVGPNYKRPVVAVPTQYRSAEQPADAPSLADTKWFDLFQDDVLKQLVNTALERNFDVRIAAERVLQARAQLGVTRSDQFPTVDANGQFVASRGSSAGPTVFIPRGTNLDVSYTQVGFSLGWELDLWGRLRRLTEAARAQYLASEESRHGVITTLISDVTSTYFALRELDLELEIAKKTRSVAEDGLRLTQLRRGAGAATGLDVRQAEQFLYTATAQIASIDREIAQTENALSFLLGNNPGDVPRGKALEAFKGPPQVPAGLPSTLLERRPDIRQAERTLISANAQIGAARAQYFPQISLTGLLGAQSRSLTDLFSGPARSWNIAPSATFPIFNANRIRSTVRFTEAQQREALLTYEKAIQNAFREVSDGLVGYRKTVEQRSQQELMVVALREAERLSTLRYRGGLDSYLQVLDSQRNLFQGELTLARLRQRELSSVVLFTGHWEEGGVEVRRSASLSRMSFRTLVSVLVFSILPMEGASLQIAELKAQLEQLGRGFDGRVGICVQDRSGAACVNAEQRYSMQSVVKLLVGLAVMDAVDAGRWKLEDRVTVQKKDLSLYVQPIAKLVTEKGYVTSIGDLMRRAVVDSDSGATDILIAKLGGPPKVHAFLVKHSIKGIRVDRDERHLQTEILGMEWRPEFVDDPVFRAAIAKVPEARRDEYYRRYQVDPRDTSTPAGMASLLHLLAEGKLLKPASTEHLIKVMAETVTFPDRLKAGLKNGWTVAHKTGTGGSWKGVSAATNDVGILTAPDGHRVAIAAFIADTREVPEKRAALMAKATSLAIDAYR